MYITTIAVCTSAILLSTVIFCASRKRRSLPKLPLPPGPKGLPVIGNILDIPSVFQWHTYQKWAKEFDTDILYVNLAGTDVIVLNTAEAASDLLEKRSSIYSGRPRMSFLNDLMGWDFNFVFMDYGQQWRTHRRLMHHSFHPAAVKQHHRHLMRSTHNFLSRMLSQPRGGTVEKVRRLAGESIITTVYGITMEENNDPYLAIAEEGSRSIIEGAVVGAFLVDVMPFLKYLPAWIPGASFQRKAMAWRQASQRLYTLPFQAAEQNIENDKSTICFATTSLEKAAECTDNAYRRDVIQGTAATIYVAGSETTLSAISSCILGLILRPDVLRRAQDEVDGVVPIGELPSFAHLSRLPYITAIVKETLRWHDAVPLGIAHKLSEEDEYKGFRIPAGATILANSWAMLHREDVYPDPFQFNPDRFMKDGKLDPSVRDPGHACWGFGRRVCQGRHFAFASIWIAIASLVACFDIEKDRDDEGHVIEPVDEIISGITCIPVEFRSWLKPRSLFVEEVIKEAVEQDRKNEMA
ncbi:hypothetical protein D9619_011206 [Psilocybe cf. subviscida]|uniref:Cytochrome P450 n=1 Tax=Psilocybe cf. subviscida TaxID=2480587 RepID=A0A8H5BIM0_9AGAR|nr:hypothetical protein D9619_011206 [Psilocybe cf. subviscida]